MFPFPPVMRAIDRICVADVASMISHAGHGSSLDLSQEGDSDPDRGVGSGGVSY